MLDEKSSKRVKTAAVAAAAATTMHRRWHGDTVAVVNALRASGSGGGGHATELCAGEYVIAVGMAGDCGMGAETKTKNRQ